MKIFSIRITITMFSIRTITMLLFTESILLICGHPNFLLSMHAWDTLFYTSENWLTDVISYGHVQMSLIQVISPQSSLLIWQWEGSGIILALLCDFSLKLQHFGLVTGKFPSSSLGAQIPVFCKIVPCS